MQYTTRYETPLGRVLLAADETGLTGLWFDGAKYYAAGLNPQHEEKEVPVFETTRRWLALYFSGQEPDHLPPVHLIGSPFQRRVWEIMLEIPYGQTIDYKVLEKIAKGEQYLRERFFGNVRLRLHGNVVRLEVDAARLFQVIEEREELVKHIKELGFDYVTLDLEGFRSGSMDIHVAAHRNS